jgi:hypothetical protein
VAAISKKQAWSVAMVKRPAKRTRVPKFRKRSSDKSASKTSASRTKNANSARRLLLTHELLAHARQRFEETDTSLAKIAIDLGVHRKTITKMARREGWLRYVRPPRDLPRAVKLGTQASALEAEVSRAAAPARASTAENDNDISAAGADLTMPPLADTVERLYRAVLEELAAVETLRAQLKREPQSPQDAERTARTLSSLTETLQKLQRLQCATPPSGSNNDDDMPADIDEFRRELARRIEAFVASRSGAGDGGGSGAAALDAAAR